PSHSSRPYGNRSARRILRMGGLRLRHARRVAVVQHQLAHNADTVVPLEQQTILITGATDGLGRALATSLAVEGPRLLLHGRDMERGRATLEAIRAQTGNERLDWLRADLASLDEVRALAGKVAQTTDRLDVLVNNAGIGTTLPGDGERVESRDGYELRFAVNYLAGYLLARSLLPLVRASAPARIVNVSSAGQAPIDCDDVMPERSY